MSDFPGRKRESGAKPGPTTLTGRWWKYPGAKEAAARKQFDLSLTRSYMLLNALIDTPAALAADPTVNRLRRLRARRQRERTRGRDSSIGHTGW